ncbi:hypothetical protein BDA99DRAFT_563663 [Phascolomyces articulosus]|uniref:Uncharacterized protein n=1 Tax=Phascolomyces articulosus TaxID=60185 RepID=A0AAD5K1A6_9FUNG|nr:hypothetical protein BDA99DRAFT_563663 [Phascolomyces articulosus]
MASMDLKCARNQDSILSYPITNDFDNVPTVDRGYDALYDTNFSEAHNITSKATDRIANQYLKILNLRAITLGMMAHFTKAEKDAVLMTLLAPSEPIGYVCMGQLHNLRGKQLQAILVYRKGFQHMEKNEDRELLVKQWD